MSEEVLYWSDLATLTHATQVEKFGWCGCEEEGSYPYDDCPKCQECEARLPDDKVGVCVECERQGL